MNKDAFRSSLTGGIVGLILAILLGFIIKAIVYEIVHVNITNILIYCMGAFGAIVGWWINYILTIRKEDSQIIKDALEMKLDKKEHQAYIDQHKQVHKQAMEMMESMDKKLDILIGKK
jgi:small-conductance mechanosensitive channel